MKVFMRSSSCRPYAGPYCHAATVFCSYCRTDGSCLWPVGEISGRGIPKGPDGKPNLSAPAPRSADGHPHLSGVWESGGAKYVMDIAARSQTR